MKKKSIALKPSLVSNPAKADWRFGTVSTNGQKPIFKRSLLA